MHDSDPWWAGPVLSTALAIVVAWLAVSFDRRKTVNQELIRKRLSVYDAMAPKLNDILCFFLLVGDFRNLSPPTLIANKRELDRTINLYRPLFSPALKARYDDFIATCFLPFGGGSGRPALIKANLEWLTAEWAADWKPEWNRGFVRPTEASDLKLVRQSYEALMGQFASELGAGKGGWRR